MHFRDLLCSCSTCYVRLCKASEFGSHEYCSRCLSSVTFCKFLENASHVYDEKLSKKRFGDLSKVVKFYSSSLPVE